MHKASFREAAMSHPSFSSREEQRHWERKAAAMMQLMAFAAKALALGVLMVVVWQVAGALGS